MENFQIYRDIQARTGGDIYIGVVGPVRTGKSTFIRRFMELVALPGMDEKMQKEVRDQLPLSGSGKMITTVEPKFIPREAVPVTLGEDLKVQVRLIDCVGFLVKDAAGNIEDGKERMVKTPWFTKAIPFHEAAKMGTEKVIQEHSTIGLVVTTDGSISDIPRSGYEKAEERVIQELEAIQKPFIILLNCVAPESLESMTLAEELSKKYGRTVMPVSCVELTEETITEILKNVLFEFPLKEIAFSMPKWVTMLDHGHWLQEAVYTAVQEFAAGASVMKDIASSPRTVECPYVKTSKMKFIDLGTGCATMTLELQDDIFYKVLGETTGLEICDEASLMPCIINLARIKTQYEKIKSALDEVNATGYGIVMPGIDELTLEEPEIVHQGGRYGVRLRASAPSINMIRTEISTEVAPIVGSERQSEELVKSLLADFEEDPGKIWQSNIFGKSLHELVNEGLQTKLMKMPEDAQEKLQETLERIINEGSGGLICIIL